MSKERGNDIPLTIEIPINYTIDENGNFILEYDTMQDDFADKMKSLDSYFVRLKQMKQERRISSACNNQTWFINYKERGERK